LAEAREQLADAVPERFLRAVPGWFSRWLPTMAPEADPPTPPHRLDR